MVLEQELKLLINSDAKIDLASLQWRDNVIAGECKTNHLISTYYDTSDLYLRSQDVGLRMRQSGGQWMQTVKTTGVVKDGLHQREEWEHDLERAEWDLVTLRQTPLGSFIDDVTIWPRLEPLFTTDFMRETVLLTTEDGSQIELAYDHGHVRSGDLQCPIHEIELELKSGDVEQLSLVANQLKQPLSLSPSNISKAQMGYTLMT